MRLFKEGERIHLVDLKGRTYALTLKAGAKFQFSGEMLLHDSLIGQEDGVEIALSRGTRFFVLYPTLAEYTLQMPRGAQILYPKDLALIPLWAGVYPGATVVEAGMGSGALTLALLQAIGEKGHLISYEIREDFAARAMLNVRAFLGETDQLTLRRADIYEGILETAVDRIVLDLPEPHRVVPHAVERLRSGGLFLAFLPTVPQVERLVATLRGCPEFEWIDTFETLLRGWNIDGRSVRPNLRMVGHSGFITTARRVRRMSKGERPPSETGVSPDATASSSLDHVNEEMT